MRKKQSMLETSVAITATVCLAAICFLLPAKIAEATELRLNETVIPMVETVEPSVKADNMLYSVEEEAGVYDNTPEAETAETAVVDDEGVIRNFRPTENELVMESNVQKMHIPNFNTLEIEGFNPEWHYYITPDEIRLIALIAELEDRDAMCEIAEVILNRILSDRFEGDTAAEIIFAPKQFYSVSRITDDMIPCDEAIQAVEAVFQYGEITVGGATFFAEKSIDKSKIAKGLYLVDYRGQTAFWGQE